MFCQNYDKSFLTGFCGAILNLSIFRVLFPAVLSSFKSLVKRRIDGFNVIYRVSLLLSNMDQHSKWTKIVL